MKPRKSDSKLLQDVEKVLATDRPFGDHRYIDERSWLQAETRLVMLAPYVAEARRTLRALRGASWQSRYRVLGDPVVRSTINTALAYFKLDGPEIPLTETKAVLQIASRQLAGNSLVAPLSIGARKARRLGRSLHHAWVWCDERDEDFPAQCFRRLFYQQEGARSALWTPDEHGHEMLRQGTELLGELLPHLAHSALNHLHLVAIVTNPSGFASVTTPSIPGTVFFSPLVLKHPWRAAEYLLHEALHLKFIDLEHTHTMLRDGYDVEASPKVRALWNRWQSDNPNEWPVNRVATVTHTYVCLALFFKVVEQRAGELEERYGPLFDLMPSVSARRAVQRAHYLGNKLKEVSEELGVGGQRFVDWLLAVLAEIEPCLPPTRSNAHLLLDLYDRETEEIREMILRASPVEITSRNKRLGSNSSDTSIRQAVLDLIQKEVASTRQLFSKMAISPVLGFDEGKHADSIRSNHASATEIAGRFYSERSAISQVLNQVVAKARDESSQMGPLNAVDEHIQAMLNESDVYIKALHEWLAE